MGQQMKIFKISETFAKAIVHNAKLKNLKAHHKNSTNTI